MTKLLPIIAIAAIASPAVADAERATPDLLNGKYHHLRFQLERPGQTPRTVVAADELTHLMVGAPVRIDMPRELGLGHGPFVYVYGRGTPHVEAADGLSVAPDNGAFIVTCRRSGMFELVAAALDVDGKPTSDRMEIGCIAPTRFAATASGRYLAGASTVYASLAWFGMRGGKEVQLVGALPIAAESDAIALASFYPDADKTDASFRALHAASAPGLVSGGLHATLAIEIVKPRWTLDLGVRRDGDRYRVDARALDESGHPLDGLSGCAIVSYTGATATPRGTRCRFDNAVAPSLRKRRHTDWTADKVCVTVLDQTACATTSDGGGG